MGLPNDFAAKTFGTRAVSVETLLRSMKNAQISTTIGKWYTWLPITH